MAKGLPADAPLPPWFLQDLEENKAKEAEAEKEKAREAVRSTNPFMMQKGLPKFESITPEASEKVCTYIRDIVMLRCVTWQQAPCLFVWVG